MSDQSDEATLRRYLLADLQDEEREKIEERLFSDERFAEELAGAEASLIDDFALKVLPQRDCDLFRKNFIFTDERRKNLVFAQAINAYVERELSVPAEVEHRAWWKRALQFLSAHKGWAIATATAVILLVVLVPVISTWFESKNHVAVSSSTGAEIQLTLQPASLLRDSGELKQIEIGKNIRFLNLDLVFSSVQHRRYKVIARTVEGDQVLTWNDLSPEPNGAATIRLKIPTASLPTNDYVFELMGIAADGSSTRIGLYNLRVVVSGR